MEARNNMKKVPKRKPVPKRNVEISLKAQAGLCACGCRGKIGPWDGLDNWRSQVTVDHFPALDHRKLARNGRDWDPGQHDPKYLLIFLRGHDRQKTFGKPATTAGSDIGVSAKIRRLQAKEAAHAAVMKRKAGL
jgi:hypothetical protein